MKPLYAIHYVVIAILLMSSCASCRRNFNKPPKINEPWPTPLNGVFVADADTLFFNGDEKSVSWHFAEGLHSIGLQGSGTYAFIFDGGVWRYDAAERFDIYALDGGMIHFGAGVPGSCTDSTVCLYRYDIPGVESKVQTFKLIK